MRTMSFFHLGASLITLVALVGGPMVAHALPCRCHGLGEHACHNIVDDDSQTGCCCADQCKLPSDAPASDHGEQDDGPCDCPFGCPVICCAAKAPATAVPSQERPLDAAPAGWLNDFTEQMPPSQRLDDLLRPPRS